MNFHQQIELHTPKAATFVYYILGSDTHVFLFVTESTTRSVCWDINQRAAVGENVLHLCFLNATQVHYDIAKLIIKKFPSLVNDIYISDEFYGEMNIIS